MSLPSLLWHRCTADVLRGMTASSAVQEERAAFSAHLSKFYPDWNGKPLEPEESVRLQLQVLEKATIEDSGSFVSQYGNKQWV